MLAATYPRRRHAAHGMPGGQPDNPRLPRPGRQRPQPPAGPAAELVLAPHHILAALGQGGQPLVFKARHTEQDWIVALKVIPHELLDSSEARQQFLSEMEAMAKLDHPNVVQFWDAGE